MSQHFLLPESVPTLALWLATALLFFSWIRLRAWNPESSSRLKSALPPLVRFLICFVTLLVTSQTLQRHVIFATSWALWPILLAGAVATELVFMLYSFERRMVPGRKGKIMVILRVVLVLLVTLALCQPVHTFEISRKIDRYVAVAVDRSASMDIADSGMGFGERIRLAEYLSILKTKRQLRIEEIVDAFRSVRQETTAQMDGISALGQVSASSSDQVSEKLRAILEISRNIKTTVSAQSAKITAVLASKTPALNDSVKGKLNPISGRISSEAVAQLDERINLLETAIKETQRRRDEKKENKIEVNYDKILENARRAIESMQKLENEIAALSEEVDTAFYISLTEEEKKAVDELSTIKRIDLATRVLTTPPPAESDGGKSVSLLQKITENYGMKAWTFASSVSELDHRGIENGKVISIEIKHDDPTALATDFNGVLGKAMSDIPAGQLAGILMLSDGRHNAPDSVETVASRLGQARIPVCSLVFGNGRRPPKDAAVVSAEAPDTIYFNDKYRTGVDVKLDNLAGQKISVNLLDGVNIVDTVNIDVKTDSVRERIQLTDKPKTVGYHPYKVVINPIDGEVEKGNNEISIPANVTDDRIKVLLIEGYPRWEFRYIKNLFASRDQSVRLQYVLLRPDKIENQSQKPAVAASAARPVEDVEATMLPANEEEWMKFDVIILGDVDPVAIGLEGMKSIKKFVAERGGSLILIAGASKMPRSFAETPFAEMIPVNFKASDVPFFKAPEESYRIVLTQEGREHVVMQLASSAEENAKIWNDIPPLYWRHPIVSAKPGAAVLAYAMPFDAPAFLKTNSSTEIPDEETLRKRRQFELENALIICQNYALGRVAMLSFDETWRLRYRMGDTYHHKFWGQFLRWATEDKIMFGSSFIKIAAGRSRYNPDENVRVRAKITRRDFSPITDLSPLMRVMRGEREITSKKLRFESNSPGIYSGDIGKLPEGNYRLELVCQGFSDDIASEASLARAEFGVASSSPAELIELTADLGTLNRIAVLTGGALAEPAMARSIMERFGPPSLIQVERREIAIWNSWPFLLLLLSLAISEWLLRKKVNLP